MSVGVIRGEEIRETRGHHPAEIVNRTPGVYVSNFGGEGHATAIRQPITTKALYAYLEDGVPIRSTGFFNHNALYEINIPQAGRLEVIKGPGTAVYGSDAVGGVVNAFTRDPSPHPEAEVFLEGGSSTYVRGLGIGEHDGRPERVPGRRERHPRRRLARGHAVRPPERHRALGLRAERARPAQDRRRALPHRSARRRRQRPDAGGLHRGAVADLLPDRRSGG